MTRTEKNFAIALQKHRAGDLAGAEALYREILVHVPGHADALHLLGVITHQSGNHGDALTLIGRAIQLRPRQADYFSNFGVVLAASGRFAEAIGAYRTALALNPRQYDACHNLGNALAATNRVDESLAAHERAISIAPQMLKSHLALANGLNRAGQIERAIERYQLVLSHAPDTVDASIALSVLLIERSRWTDARLVLRSALQFSPNDVRLLVNLSGVLKELGALDEAEAVARDISAVMPKSPVSHVNLGAILKELGRVDDAIVEYREAFACDADRPELLSELIFALNYAESATPTQISEAARLWDERFGNPPRVTLAALDRDPNRRLRIGYLSADFRKHSVGFNMLPIIEHHDRSQVEVFCYSNNRSRDEQTDRIEAAADAWRVVIDDSDDGAAQRIAADRIDVLIELSMHTVGNRLPVMARKPAPVQMSYLAYPGSTGLSAIDFRLTEAVLDPPLGDFPVKSEKALWLPRAYWCFLVARDFPEPSRNENAGEITFGCLNKFAKVSPGSLNLWMRVLHAIPRSRLILHCPAGSAEARVRTLFESARIDPDRLEILPRQPWPQYIGTYQRIDLSLDPFPFGGGITTLDSLWMGTPVLTFPQARPTSRGAASILTAIGLTDWIATSPDDFVERAVQLSSNRALLAELRGTLRDRLRASPICDPASLCRGIEAAVREAWKEFCERFDLNAHGSRV